MVNILERHYPESQGLTLIVNCPWILYAAWRLVKGMLDARTVDKVTPSASPLLLFAHATVQFVFIDVKELVQYVDEDSLLQEYGGNDPFVYSYVPPDKRVGEHSAFVPCWELPWRNAPLLSPLDTRGEGEAERGSK